jgi:hypothetical protein
MTAVPKRRPGIRAAERSIRGTMVARSTARQTTVGTAPAAAPRPALPAAPPAAPSVTASSRVAIPTRRAESLPETESRPEPRARLEPRQPPSLRSQGRAPQRAIEPPPVVRQIGPRGRRAETFDEAPAQAPSKMAELRSTIARLQQRLDEIEPGAARVSDLRERHDLVVELLDEALELLARPEGVMNRRRLRLKLEEARKVLG